MTTAAERPSVAGFPVNLVLQGRRVVVVGAGRIAARKATSLMEVGAEVEVIAPRVGTAIALLAEAGLVRVVERAFEPADLDGAWLAIAATGDSSVDGDVFAAGEERQVFVNAADDPSNCSATLMSVMRRGELQISIGTGGRSPALAIWLKKRLEGEIGPEYETLLDLLSAEREQMRLKGRSSEDADWQTALNSGILELIRADKVHEAKERLRTCLTSSLD